jgi:hypothetical protein
MRKPYVWIFFALLAVGPYFGNARGQSTQINPINQLNTAVPIDFSGAASTKPAKAGAQLPPTCSLGEMFVKTNAAAGANVYVCTTAPGTWTAQGGGIGFSNLTTCGLARTSSTTLTIAASTSDPCNVRVGNVVTPFPSSATITISAGTGTVRAAFDTSVSPPALKVYQGGLTFTCAGMSCNSVSGSAFTTEDIEIATATATSGSWDSNGLTDLRAFAGRDRSVAGNYLASSNSGGTWTVNLDNVTFGFKLNPGLGANLASGATITPTNRVHHVTGTTTIQTIAITNVSDGESFTMIFDGVAPLGTSGNIAAAITPTVNKIVVCVFTVTNAKWYCQG